MLSFWQVIVIGAVVIFALFLGTWLLSRRLNNYSFVDIMWSYSFAVLAGLEALLSSGYILRRVLMFAMAALWSFRLGTHLLRRIASHHPHEDVRYQVLRAKWKDHLGSHFFLFFQAQGVMALLMFLPFLIAMRNPAPQMTAVEWTGLAMWLIGVSGESIADAQMRRFKANPASKGKVCEAGLWHYSRHPNYFFESVIWWGFWLFACGSPWGWTTLYAPLMMLYFLLCVTGIPLTEKCSLESKGDLYRDYQRRTSAFVPWFPRAPS
jgi:steroid 5-alpha reductase family enzyme